MRKTAIKLKRVYETPSASDGTRILVERLWPRGLTKADAAIDEWVKDVAPSPELRKWYGHDPAKWQEFQRRYRRELGENQTTVDHLRALVGVGPTTFVYAAKDEARNSAVVLKAVLEKAGSSGARSGGRR